PIWLNCVVHVVRDFNKRPGEGKYIGKIGRGKLRCIKKTALIVFHLQLNAVAARFIFHLGSPSTLALRHASSTPLAKQKHNSPGFQAILANRPYEKDET